LPGQLNERRLEGVLGVVPVAKHSPADAQDQRAMPPHQRREGGSSRWPAKRSKSWPSDNSAEASVATSRRM
jgi:hypothetical protein